ncbi:BgTH12-03868 [Blumeria graminis f. sp. triticale]|uniref:Bgt-351 n=3 Tax=Blumeria graminis TaxID=34373 RepID=A0A9X9PRE4_BLUGR|nr:hypothetical protein BGT96224_351 [Blumeria graminis f. sp. tritici 96224]CAD6499760.1 BgTH12-03868 [Blumeria graminis f. sp. triticale]VCU39931.1 Bgt-351 [Blumeria graminis f. sp. tritici]
MSDYEAESGGSDSSSAIRLNRFQGKPQKWQYLTEQERGVYASLVKARDEDLGIHLYNAHILRQRAKEYQENPVNARINSEYTFLPEHYRTYKPPDRWTAWPLPPDLVPKGIDNDLNKDGYDQFTFKREKVNHPSTELEEILVAVALKDARKKFEDREFEDDLIQSQESDSTETTDNDSYQPNGGNTTSLEIETDHTDTSETKNLESPSVPNLTPIFNLDDDKSFQQLRPLARHNIIKIDEVLMALHNTRKTCHGFKSPEQRIEKVSTSNQTLANVVSEVASKPTSEINLTRIIETDEHQTTDPSKKTRGRPPKTYERLDEETDEAFLVRIARLRKKSIPNFALSEEARRPKKTSTPKTKLEPRSPKFSGAGYRNKRNKRLGLRDWSELLGSAALAGIPRDVIARATQRCANLFDEGMEMRSMNETPMTGKDSDLVTRYTPCQFHKEPSLDPESTPCNSHSSAPFSKARKTRALIPEYYKPRSGPTLRQVYFCSVSLCPRRINGFKDQDSLVRHLRKGHGFDENFIKENLSSDEDLVGAVHVDGFLKRLKTRGEVKNKNRLTSHRNDTRATSHEKIVPVTMESASSEWVSSDAEDQEKASWKL